MITDEHHYINAYFYYLFYIPIFILCTNVIHLTLSNIIFNSACTLQIQNSTNI